MFWNYISNILPRLEHNTECHKYGYFILQRFGSRHHHLYSTVKAGRNVIRVHQFWMIQHFSVSQTKPETKIELIYIYIISVFVSQRSFNTTVWFLLSWYLPTSLHHGKAGRMRDTCTAEISCASFPFVLFLVDFVWFTFLWKWAKV